MPARDTGTQPLPATGPYVIADYRPTSVLRLVRNPYFHEWSQAAQPDGYPDEIVLRIGGDSKSAVDDVLGGKGDAPGWPNRWPRVGDGARDPLCERGARESDSRTQALFLNTRVPPFDNSTPAGAQLRRRPGVCNPV